MLLGGLLEVFSFGKWMVPLAAWLAPVFLLHFARSTTPVLGALGIWLAVFLAMSVSNRGILPVPGAARYGVTALIAATSVVPFLADRLLAPVVPGLFSTLVLPVAWVALEFIALRASPMGTWGAVGYTQHGNLPLMQLTSVTGIWGISFLVFWFAAVANWAWDRQFEWAAVQGGVLLYAGIWCSVMFAGGARLALAPNATTIRIAGIGWPQGIIEPAEFVRAVAPDLTDTERQAIREAFYRIQDSFLERTRREAQAGAKIVAWPEANLMVFKEHEAAFLERARGFARQNGIFLLMGMGTLDPGAARPVENKAVLLGPAGETIYSYIKITAVPGFEASVNIRGKGPIPVADTPLGRIASPICFDLDFPQVIRQTARSRADLMLVPASDFKDLRAVGHLHQRMAEFRAVENGAALFRIARWGVSSAVDAYGRQLATMEDFMTRDSVMVAQVPGSAGVRTAYARVGDLFAWLCVASAFAGIGWALLRP